MEIVLVEFYLKFEPTLLQYLSVSFKMLVNTIYTKYLSKTLILIIKV